MAQPCGSCGSTLWYASKSWVEDGEIVTVCSDCHSGLRACGGSSVYFAPNRDGVEINPNIADSNGDPIPLVSREHKAAMMKKFNLREAGDRVRGYRNFDPISYRHGMESLKSADNRRKKNG